MVAAPQPRLLSRPLVFCLVWLGVRGDASVAQIRNTAEIDTLSALAGRNEGTQFNIG